MKFIKELAQNINLAQSRNQFRSGPKHILRTRPLRLGHLFAPLGPEPVHETSTVHLNRTATCSYRWIKTLCWLRPPLTLAIHFHFARLNASESRVDRAKQNGGDGASGDPTHR
jgi:hypothetical protein